jgi:UDP-GlcNAc:undecaprenyl-phosphate GlcNAc-1-phosphate transferase
LRVVIISLLSCVTLVLLLRGIVHYSGIGNHLGRHNQREYPISRVGGLAVYIAIMAAMAVNHSLRGNLLILLGCSALMMVLGLLVEKQRLSVPLRILIQACLVTLVIVEADGSVTHIGAIVGPDISLGMLSVPFTVVAFIGGINAIRTIDGEVGLAAKMALITTLGVTTICYLAGVTRLPMELAMLGALSGFLLLNSRLLAKRPWVFMGDSGSMWLGLVLGWFMVQLTHDTVSAEPALVLWLFGVPLLDTLAEMMRRLKYKRTPFNPDRTHIHLVLEYRGFPARSSALILMLLHCVSVGIGVFFYLVYAPSFVVFWSFMLMLGMYYFGLRNYDTSLREKSMQGNASSVSFPVADKNDKS